MRSARPLSDSVTLVRPLLAFRRSALEAYLAELGQLWRTDATNRDSTFTRNRIRHELLPQLARDFNPAVSEALLRLGASAAEAQEALRYAAEQLAAGAVIVSRPDRIEIDCRPLTFAPVYLRTMIVNAEWSRQNWPQQGMTREHWQRLSSMIAGSAWVVLEPEIRTAWIYYILIYKPFRGRGLGRALLARLHDLARETGTVNDFVQNNVNLYTLDNAGLLDNYQKEKGYLIENLGKIGRAHV